MPDYVRTTLRRAARAADNAGQDLEEATRVAYVAGYSARDIGNATGVSMHTALRRIERAEQRAKKRRGK